MSAETLLIISSGVLAAVALLLVGIVAFYWLWEVARMNRGAERRRRDQERDL